MAENQSAMDVMALRRRALRRLREGSAAGRSVIAPGVDRTVLSFAQHRLWFVDEMADDSRVYHVPVAFRVGGVLDVDRLRRAIQATVRRHEVLRTSFAASGGQPVAVVAPESDVPVVVVEVSERELSDAVRGAVVEPFDLSAGPLLRARVFEVSPVDRVVLLVLHHVVCDGWSLEVLLRELSAAYAGEALPALSIQYADFASWQRNVLSGEALADQLAYWRDALAGAPEVVGLPWDRPRPARAGFVGGTRRATVGEETVRRLEELCRTGSASVFMGLFAAFGAVLCRWADVDDVVVGTPIANRTRTETEELIGFFVNMLPIRFRADGGLPFGELVARVRDTALAAYAHQDLPFERLVEELAPARSLAHHPVFQTSFAFRNTGSADLRLPGLDVEPFAMDWGIAKYDLALEAVPARDGTIGLIADYRTDLFDTATIDRLLDWYVRLLDQATTSPNTPLSTVDLTSADEIRIVMAAGTGSPCALPEACVHELVAGRADAHPDGVAVVDGDRVVRSGELVARANRLAWWLRGLGVGRGDVVGLVLPRGVELAVSALAVLSVGAAYLPIDPGVPVERLRFMVEDSSALVVVGRGRPPVDVPWVDLAGDAAKIDLQPSTDLGVRCSAEDMAYVIYTSGSTGRPKGVVVPHRGLSNLVSWHVREVGLGSGDRTSLVASPGFDASVWELWPSLVAGASVHVPGEEVRSDPDLLLEWFADNGITAAFVPTPLAEMMFTRAAPPLSVLRVLSTGGDVLTSGPSASYRVLNNYGPTENSVVATACEIQPGAQNFPIGRPIDNVRAYVVGQDGRPVGVGVSGELRLGGAGLAHGYLGNPTLTAERFVPDPFGPPGARLYRTGDLARWNPGGDLEFLGRADHQVQIRGHRVELGEIESVLAEHPAVDTAVVVVRTDQGEPVLTGYLKGRPDLDDVRRHLVDRLPGYMVPPVLGVVEQWPMTASGKIDRKALPPLETPAGRPVSGAVEQALADVWAEVLNLTDPPGARDDFFGLGGNSLNATRITSRVHAVLGVRIPIRNLFETPTIEGLARFVAEAGRSTAPALVRQEADLYPGLDPTEVEALLGAGDPR
ncbi:non-ribosomal peptide synthetase [Actinosynnema sp. CS-041913]|uniref:non-ribosomal peptide synthetase n=1 Tax=Actinosynnema sp. CS-041913 TaxID=3239917 RepID=UPI003D8C29C8